MRERVKARFFLARRRNLAGGGAQSSPPPPHYLWVRATSYGDGSGSSLDNAAAFADLPLVLADAPPGATIALYSGDVFPAATLALTASNGTADRPILITGMNGNGQVARALVQGTRTAFSFPTDPEAVTEVAAWNQGERCIQLADAAASYLDFQAINFNDVSTPFDFIHGSGTIHQVGFSQMNLRNTYCFIDHAQASGGETFAEAIDGITIEQFDADGFSNHFIRIRGKDASHYAQNILIQDANLNSHRQDGSNFACGVHFDGYARNAEVKRVTVANCHDTQGNNPAAYWDGSGFASERGNDNILYEDCTASGCTDGGFDLKSTNTTLTNPVAFDNKRNCRLWEAEYTVTNPNFYGAHGRGGIAASDPQAMWAGSGTAFSGGIVRVRGGTVNGVINLGFNSVPGRCPTAITLLGVNEPAIADEVSGGGGCKLIRAAAAVAGSPVLLSPLDVDGTLHVRVVQGTNPVLPALSWDRDIFYAAASGLSGLSISDRASPGIRYTAPAYTGVSDHHDFQLTVEDVDGSQTSITVRLIVLNTYADLYIAAASDAGHALSSTEQARLEAFCTDAAAVLPKLDRLFFLAQENEPVALANFLKPSHTLNNHGCAFTADRGEAGNNTSAYISDDAGWIFPVGGQFGVDPATGGDAGFGFRTGTFGAWCNLQGSGVGTGGSTHVGGDTVDTHFQIRARADAAQEAFGCLGTAVNSGHAGTSRLGHRTVKRSDSATIRSYFNGASLGDVASAELAPQSLPCLFRSNTTYYPDQLAVFYAGAVLSDAEVTTLHNALNTYLTAKGAA